MLGHRKKIAKFYLYLPLYLPLWVNLLICMHLKFLNNPIYKEQQIPLLQKIESHLLEYETIVGEAVENGINVVTQVRNCNVVF